VRPREHVRQHPHLHPERELRADARAHAVQRLAVEVLHRDEVAITVLPDLRRLHHVRVVQARREPRLVEEHGEKVRVLGELTARLLEHDELVEPRRSLHHREVDVRHAAAADLGDQPVLP